MTTPYLPPLQLSETFWVSPQILPGDVAALAAHGVRTVLCNRPDAEVPPAVQADAIEAACAKAGLAFLRNPLSHGTLSMEHIERQKQAIDSADTPVLAYCASGNRSSVLWALAMAGRMPTEEILRHAEAAGYQLGGLAGQIDALAAG